jgi:hypothetical protein
MSITVGYYREPPTDGPFMVTPHEGEWALWFVTYEPQPLLLLQFSTEVEAKVVAEAMDGVFVRGVRRGREWSRR